jgi:hypothetical protein
MGAPLRHRRGYGVVEVVLELENDDFTHNAGPPSCGGRYVVPVGHLPLMGLDVPDAVGAPGWQSGPQLVDEEVVCDACAVVLVDVVVVVLDADEVVELVGAALVVKTVEDAVFVV